MSDRPDAAGAGEVVDHGSVAEARAAVEEEGGFGDPGAPGAAAPVKPLPPWERHLPRIYLVALGVAVLVLLLLPDVASAYQVTLALTIMLTVSLATSWNVISGFTGYTSFGHAGFFGIGSYVGALLLYHDLMPWMPAMVAAGLATAAVGLAIGYPTLRLRGPYFAIAMLGLSEIARIVVTAWDSLTRVGLGVSLPIVRFPLPTEDPSLRERAEFLWERWPNYYAMLGLTVVAVVVGYLVGTSGFGLRLRSIRDDEAVAQAMGIDTTRHKLAAFCLSSFFPGAAGAIYARHVGFIEPASVFAIIWSIRAIATSIFGGQGTILGPIVGAVTLTLVSEWVWTRSTTYYQVIYGGIIVLVVLFLPGGLMALLQRRGWLPRSRRL